MMPRKHDDAAALWVGRVFTTAALILSFYVGGWATFGVVVLAALGGAALGVGA